MVNSFAKQFFRFIRVTRHNVVGDTFDDFAPRVVDVCGIDKD